jgi:hypothetical protein
MSLYKKKLLLKNSRCDNLYYKGDFIEQNMKYEN